ncbi:MAG TPA: phage terminase small subunit P27 family [Chloroflexota bacterium]|nr:phage terminase small subunit P27 family [Chloroflexota bacterium]
MAGRRPLPTAVKKLRGKPGHRALNTLEPVADVGEPPIPPDLPKLAVEEWKDIVPKLLRLKVLSDSDGKALAAYCFAYARWREAEEEVGRHGILIEEPVMGGPADNREVVGYKYKRNPAIQVVAEFLKIMKSYLVEFGLTPAARSRLRIEKPKEADPLELYLLKKQNASKHVN